MNWFQKYWHKIIATSVAIILVVYASYIIFYPIKVESQEVQISEGVGVKGIARILANNGVIGNKYIFLLYVTALGEDKNLKAGNYKFEGRISMNDVVYVLSRGRSEDGDIRVTIPEGMNVWEIDKVFAKAELIASGVFAKAAIDYEGRLFPDTYRLKKDADVQDIISRMAENYLSKTKGISEDKIIIASMLEKEAKTKEDMKIVAGIIHKRLGMDMLLQVDATVAYGACRNNHQLSLINDNYQYCDIALVPIASEIKIDGPYNTYTRKGLPPGPISNPGLDAIEAALNPTETDFLYYLSTRDGSRIIYSKTAEEHLQNRRKYLGF